MRFRRRTFRRRRRAGANLAPLSICSNSMIVENGNLCTEPTSTAILLQPLMGMEKIASSSASAFDVEESTFRKGLSVQGMRFHWAVFPANYIAEGSPFFLSVRIALVKLECDTSGVPAFIPNLFSRLDTDLGDVLWRGASIIVWPRYCIERRTDGEGADCGDIYNSKHVAVGGSNDCDIACQWLLNQQYADSFAGAGLPNATGSYSRSGSHSQMERVKTKRFLKPNEAIYFVISAHSPLEVEAFNPAVGYEFFGYAATRSRV